MECTAIPSAGQEQLTSPPWRRCEESANDTKVNGEPASKEVTTVCSNGAVQPRWRHPRLAGDGSNVGTQCSRSLEGIRRSVATRFRRRQRFRHQATAAMNRPARMPAERVFRLRLRRPVVPLGQFGEFIGDARPIPTQLFVSSRDMRSCDIGICLTCPAAFISRKGQMVLWFIFSNTRTACGLRPFHPNDTACRWIGFRRCHRDWLPRVQSRPDSHHVARCLRRLRRSKGTRRTARVFL